MTPLSNLPDYVERGCEQVWRAPDRATDTVLYGFIVRADPAAIDAMLAHDLNLPSGHAVDYRCAHEHVIVTFGAIGHESSADPVDAKRGYISEHEVSVWCLAADMHAAGRLVWYVPYIFTNSQQTVSTGREIFGYPKQLGQFPADYPAGLDKAGAVTTITSLAIRRFAPDAEAKPLPMLSVTRKRGSAALRKAPPIVEAIHATFAGISVDPTLHAGPRHAPKTAITPAGASPPPRAASPPPPWIKAPLHAILAPTLLGENTSLVLDMIENTTLVFLKQFRDVSCPTKACYQAVIEAPITFHLGGASYEALDPERFELTVSSWASNPIAAQLGIPAGKPADLTGAFRATLGFDIGLGLERWRAPA